MATPPPTDLLPEAALALASGALWLSEQPRWRGAAALGAQLAGLAALVLVLVRAPALHAAYLGAPLTVLVGTAGALALGRVEGFSPRLRALLVLATAILLRLATFPAAGASPLLAAALVVPAAALARRGPPGPAALAWLCVALPAGLAGALSSLVWRAGLPAAALGWAGALVMSAAHLQAARAQSLRAFARWVSLAACGGLVLSAGLLARAPSAFGALAGAVLACGLPTLGLLSVTGLAAEAGDPETRWASCAGLAQRNRALVSALALSLLALAGLPLTIGFAAKVRLIQSGAATGLLAPVGLALLNAVILTGLSLWVLRPLTHLEPREREPWVGDSATTLLCLGACAGVLAGGVWWPGLGAGG